MDFSVQVSNFILQPTDKKMKTPVQVNWTGFLCKRGEKDELGRFIENFRTTTKYYRIIQFQKNGMTC